MGNFYEIGRFCCRESSLEKLLDHKAGTFVFRLCVVAGFFLTHTHIISKSRKKHFIVVSYVKSQLRSTKGQLNGHLNSSRRGLSAGDAQNC